MNIVLENVLIHSERWSRLDFYKMYWWFILNATVENILMQKENAALETYWCKSKRRRVAVVAWPFLPCMYDPALLRPFWFVRWMVRFETALMTVDQVDTTQRNGRTWTGRPTGEGRIQVRGHFQWIAPTKLVLFMNIKAPVFFWGALFTPHILNNDSQWRKKQNSSLKSG